MSLVLLTVADGGPLTEQVVETSLQLRTATEGFLNVVHVRDADLRFAADDPRDRPAAGGMDGERFVDRAAKVSRIWSGHQASTRALLHDLAGSEREILIPRARASDLSIVARPGQDPERPEPSYVNSLVFESGRPVLVVPPTIQSNWLASALIVWNNTAQSARAVAAALPLLRLAKSVTIACFGAEKSRGPTGELLDYLRHHGIAAQVIGVDPGGVSARGRGRAVVSYAWMTGAGFTIMGAYGEPGLMSFLGLGGATGKVITATRTPLLLAH